MKTEEKWIFKIAEELENMRELFVNNPNDKTITSKTLINILKIIYFNQNSITKSCQ